ncbi:MAG TPA: lipoprotein-releasing ABC transporter permease subunit, partial [Burkholderiales bacterium]|nr:lipoprotein-releasing ABC transporter permease subunit [Burkholderiales bacterium]
YTRSRRRHRIISFISLISIIGITLAIAALITILSVMNGFGNEVRSRILSFISHVTITEPNGNLREWETLGTRIQSVPRVLAYAPFINGQALVARGKNVNGVMVRGVLPEREIHISDVAGKVIEGSMDALKPGEFGVLIGYGTAWKLDLKLGSQVSLVVPQAQASPAGLLPRFKRFTVVGIFKADMYEYDAGLVLINIDDAAKLYQLPDQVSGLRLKLDNVDIAPRVAAEIEQIVGPEYRVRDWTREHNAWFRALAMEKTVMFIILSLIVAVAMFNVVSTMIVVVNEKRSDIAILRTLGASPRSILGVFMIQGSIIGVVGTLVGVVVGILLALNVGNLVRLLEVVFNTRFLAPEIYFISELPSDLQWGDVTVIAVVSLVLSFLSTLYPAWRAAQTQPAEALRYE